MILFDQIRTHTSFKFEISNFNWFLKNPSSNFHIWKTLKKRLAGKFDWLIMKNNGSRSFITLGSGWTLKFTQFQNCQLKFGQNETYTNMVKMDLGFCHCHLGHAGAVFWFFIHLVTHNNFFLKTNIQPQNKQISLVHK